MTERQRPRPSFNPRAHDNYDMDEERVDEPKCHCCGRYGHVKADCKMAEKKCDLCGKVGHLKSTCRSEPQDGKGYGKKGGKSSGKDDGKGHGGGGSYRERDDGKGHGGGGSYRESERSYKESANSWRESDKGYRESDRGYRENEKSYKSIEYDTCLCCGKPGHSKADCHLRDVGCKLCGMMGHVKATCRQADDSAAREDSVAVWTQSGSKGGKGGKKGRDRDDGYEREDSRYSPYGSGKGKGNGKTYNDREDGVCNCCGKVGHLKADCAMKDKACDLCGRIGHLKSMCRSADEPSHGSQKGKAKGGGHWVWQPEEPKTPPPKIKAATSEEVCICCGKKGHRKKDCDYLDEKCQICNKKGHLAKVCRNISDPPVKGKLGIIKSNMKIKAAKGGSVPDNTCLCCGKVGHQKADCRFKDAGCNICGGMGHIAKTCRHGDDKAKEKPVKAKKQTGAGKPKQCYNCREVGHEMADCPEPKLCRVCMSDEHERKDCPMKDTACDTCGKQGHISEFCRLNEAVDDEEDVELDD